MQQFLRLQTGNAYTIRFIGPVLLAHMTYFDTVDAPSVSSQKWTTRLYSNEEFEAGVIPEDEGKPKARLVGTVMKDGDLSGLHFVSFPLVVFRPVKNFVEGRNRVKHPGARVGCSINIAMTGTGIRTEYNVHCERHRLSDEEYSFAMKNRLDPYELLNNYGPVLRRRREERESARFVVQERAEKMADAIRAMGFRVSLKDHVCSVCRGRLWTSLMDRCECNPEPMSPRLLAAV